MDNTRKVALATADRAERGILEPVVKRLEKLHADGAIEFDIVVGTWMGKDEVLFDLSDPLPDVILIPADRREMVQLALWAYYKRIPVFHLWAGIGYTGTWDDLNRRVISSFAYLMLCEDELCRLRLIAAGEEPWRCVVTGTPHYDDLEVDESLVPSEPYDLLLINSNPAAPEDYDQSVHNAVRLLDKRTIEIGATDQVPTIHTRLGSGYQHDFYSTLPRPKLLGLLKNCERFISNSSAAVYEAPYFGVEVVNPGKRNLARTTDAEKKPGAADRIVELLANYPLEKSKLLKVYD